MQSESFGVNKSSLTNGVALAIVLSSYLVTEPTLQVPLANIGFFALSGAFTNWIAIYMLFERVPGFYGSGVIELQFEALKLAIKQLIQDHFFTKKHLAELITQEKKSLVSTFETSARSLDYDKLFQGFLDAVMQSSLGGMLNMVGGVKALEPLRAKFHDKIQEVIVSEIQDPIFQAKLSSQFESDDKIEHLQASIDRLISSTLSHMTPLIVKNLMKKMIARHLGWLVVWGGVFGGLLGLLKSFW